jgi:hypothetical protein
MGVYEVADWPVVLSYIKSFPTTVAEKHIRWIADSDTVTLCTVYRAYKLSGIKLLI